MNTPKFLIGEQVERVMDGAVGKVMTISEFDGGITYLVNLGREPMEGHTDDCWWEAEQAWRRHFRTHAHVVTNSRDCDGDYEHRHVDRPSAIERTEEFGDLNFKERVMGYIISFHVEGTLAVTPKGMLWTQDTEEGYIRSEVWWCEQDDCDDQSTQRDFRAEQAGY